MVDREAGSAGQEPVAGSEIETEGVIFLRSTASSGPDLPIAERFAATVFNTGNLFFEAALLRHLVAPKVVGSLEALPERVDHLVLSMSNFVSEATDLGYIALELERRRVRQIVMVGAGAQAYGYGDKVRLTPGTLRFLHLLADRSVSIGVRGFYTAEVLHGLGVRNVDVIGCPSAFWQGADLVAPSTEALSWQPRLAVHATPLGHFRDKVSALLGHGLRHGADYILQSEMWLTPLLDRELPPGSLDDELSYYANPECAAGPLRTWLAAHLRAFFDIHQWIEAMHEYDFVYGSRFHGNMAAVQAGVPALNLVFDTRTRELCEYLNLPFMPLQEFRGDLHLRALFEQADFGLFRATYPGKLARYAAFLEANGLSHRLPRAAVAEVAAPDGDTGPEQSAPSSVRVRARATVQVLADGLEVGHTAEDLLGQAARRLRPDRPAAVRDAVERGVFTADGTG